MTHNQAFLDSQEFTPVVIAMRDYIALMLNKEPNHEDVTNALNAATKKIRDIILQTKDKISVDQLLSNCPRFCDDVLKDMQGAKFLESATEVEAAAIHARLTAVADTSTQTKLPVRPSETEGIVVTHKFEQHPMAFAEGATTQWGGIFRQALGIFGVIFGPGILIGSVKKDEQGRTQISWGQAAAGAALTIGGVYAMVAPSGHSHVRNG